VKPKRKRQVASAGEMLPDSLGTMRIRPEDQNFAAQFAIPRMIMTAGQGFIHSFAPGRGVDLEAPSPHDDGAERCPDQLGA
jgi:hypothetical protein